MQLSTQESTQESIQVWEPLKEAGAKMTPATWYAKPLGKQSACELLDQVECIQQQLYLKQTSSLFCTLQAMIARYWIGRSIETEYQNLCNTSTTRFEKALIEIVFGQLLISNKLRGATEHLQRGFIYAKEFLDAEEYFPVLHCYESLSLLPLSVTPHPAQDLRGLLNEAAVINILEKHTGSKKNDAVCRHFDTIN